MNFFTERKPNTPAKRKEFSLIVPWIEKYRPKSLDDIVHQTEAVSVLKQCLINKEIPNLLLYGPPGTGKTSIILAVAHQLFGPLFKERVLELNASDERGIQVIREKVKKFAQIAVAQPKNKDIPSFKLIVLDEADSMTTAAQAALRRIMETELRTTRFCLTCNYITRIIDPITSRCAKFRFKVLDQDVALTRLRHIAEEENLQISAENMEQVIRLAQGDMRRAVTFLQTASMIAEKDEDGMTKINEQFLDEAAGIVPQEQVTRFLEVAKEQDINTVYQQVNDLLAEGFSATQLIAQLQQIVLQSNSFSDLKKAVILKAIGIMDSRLMEGADERLQLLSLSATIVQQAA
ncbi:replication factor C subunit 4 [Cichlidogyrus casuarinus]|uniref:Replication factor C subunit 4 n=1 Tax=Cichlidogyrus casuarinus TaxID=1844966 RepID=A0ABD2PX44_9PLAT